MGELLVAAGRQGAGRCTERSSESGTQELHGAALRQGHCLPGSAKGRDQALVFASER